MLSRSEKILRVSYHQLYHATEAFSSKNLVGSGSFGSVYKGKLKQQQQQQGEKLVAVKVLHLEKTGASRSFETECRTLRNIRHRNLVPILTYCSSIDLKGNQFKALVYEFMENGNLDEWLHMARDITTTTTENLDILQRLSIAIDVASALQYLHHDCGEGTIVHCDLKPSNILLKSDLTAVVSDFGLARLVPKASYETYPNHGTTSTTIAIKGSIGYAAPEYGMGAEASTEGDVYSYGILLLEMFTGKRPTDDIFTNGLDLHSYVKMNLTKKVFEIADPLLVSDKKKEEEDDDDDDNDDTVILQKCLGYVFSIGVKCSATVPNDRIQVNEILGELHHVKNALIGEK